ncbi:helix-turn-helix transcriptional regulator [Haliangium sp.]|uniref:helix-turn-helix transcriptional regulator n=1 Tax=Haliangium sp. TaxID=2663208 RepID=UPI003D0D5F11
MRRADRLFQIVSILRGRRLTTAAQLAARLEVSERTVYRDVADLMRSGVPIAGEAGVGYQLDKHFELPPLMFRVDEIQALVLGVRMVEAWADDELRQAARAALDKIEAALPAGKRSIIDTTALFSLSFQLSDDTRRELGRLRRAVDERRKVRLSYRDGADAITTRVVRPLGLYFWGKVWTLAAWCELRTGFRVFRIDRIEAAEPCDETFALEPPVTLEDFVREIRARDG